MTTTSTSTINGIDVEALQGVVESVKADHTQGIAGFGVTTRWTGGTKTETDVREWSLGGQRLAKNFTIKIDEPPELLGENTAPNPQEFLFAAVNACMAATFVAACSVNGIELESFEIESSGELDLRGFLAIDARVPSGYERVRTIFRVKGNASEEQFEQILEHVRKTSPNFYNLAESIDVRASVEVK